MKTGRHLPDFASRPRLHLALRDVPGLNLLMTHPILGPVPPAFCYTEWKHESVSWGLRRHLNKIQPYLKRPATFRTRFLILGVLLCLWVLGFWEGAARAESGNFFSFALAGGGAIAPGADLESSPPLGEVRFDPGYSFKTSFGFLLARKFHLEAEYLYTYNRIDARVNPPTVTPLVASDRLTYSVMLNATYRMETPPLGDVYWERRGCYFYVGGGAGMAWQDYTVETVATVTDYSLAWQVFIGFE